MSHFIYIYKVSWKSSKPHPERKDITEHGNPQPLFTK